MANEKPTAAAPARSYVNPTADGPANRQPKPKKLRPRKPTGSYLVVEPVWVPAGKDGKLDLKIGDRVSIDQLGEERIAELEAKKLVEAEWADVVEGEG